MEHYRECAQGLIGSNSRLSFGCGMPEHVKIVYNLLLNKAVKQVYLFHLGDSIGLIDNPQIHRDLEKAVGRNVALDVMTRFDDTQGVEFRRRIDSLAEESFLVHHTRVPKGFRNVDEKYFNFLVVDSEAVRLGEGKLKGGFAYGSNTKMANQLIGIFEKLREDIDSARDTVRGVGTAIQV